MATTPTPMRPITMAPQADIPPHHYVCLRKTQVCLRCQTQHSWTELYSETHLRSRLHAGKYVTNWRPIKTLSDIQYNLPITQLTHPVDRVPMCFECSGQATLAHLPQPPQPKADPVNLTKPAAAAATAAKEKSVKHKPTIDDLSF